MDCAGAKMTLLSHMACNTSFWSSAHLGVESWIPLIITQDTFGYTILYGGDWCSHLVYNQADHTAKYQEFREAVRNGELGEICRFWNKYTYSIQLDLMKRLQRLCYSEFIHTYRTLNASVLQGVDWCNLFSVTMVGRRVNSFRYWSTGKSDFLLPERG